jgi:hypothetical protein
MEFDDDEGATEMKLVAEREEGILRPGLDFAFSAGRMLLSTLALLCLVKQSGIDFLPMPIDWVASTYDSYFSLLLESELPVWTGSTNELLVYAWYHISGVHLTLQPIWKHVFMLMWIYFGKQASDVGTMVFEGTENLLLSAASSVSYRVMGLFAALVASTAVGLAPQNGGVLGAGSAVALTISGVLLYDFLTSTLGAFTIRKWLPRVSATRFEWVRENSKESVRRGLFGVLISCAVLPVAWYLRMPNPAVITILLLVLALAVYWATLGFHGPNSPTYETKQHYRVYGSTLGKEMLVAFATPRVVVLWHLLDGLAK